MESREDKRGGAADLFNACGMREARIELSKDSHSVFAGFEICHDKMERNGSGEAVQCAVRAVEFHQTNAVPSH